MTGSRLIRKIIIAVAVFEIIAGTHACNTAGNIEQGISEFTGYDVGFIAAIPLIPDCFSIWNKLITL